MRTDRDNVIAELEAAAVTDAAGGRWVRQHAAASIIGTSKQTIRYWRDTGRLRAAMFRLDPRRTRGDGQRLAPGRTCSGRVTCLHLVDLIECVEAARLKHRWSDADDELILERLGFEDFEAVAQRIGCTEQAVRKRAQVLGVGLWSNQAEGVAASVVARMLGCSLSTVYRWCRDEQDPLPAWRCAGRHGVYQIDLRRLLAWLDAHQPRVWRWADAATRARLARLAGPTVGGTPPGRKEAA